MNDQPLWTSVAADGSAESIRIIDLDVGKTTWSRVHESMRVVHLRLNRQPDLQWIKFFHEERESRIGVRRRGLWIEDGYIAFDCLTHEVESHHLPDIRGSVAYANEHYAAFVAARVRDRGDTASAGRAELAQLEALRGRLRAHLGSASPTPAAPTLETAPLSPPAKVGSADPVSGPLIDAHAVQLHDTAVQAEAAVAHRRQDKHRIASDGLEESLAEYRARLRAARRTGSQDPDR